MPVPESHREKLLILGTGSFAPEVADVADDTGRYDVDGFVENWDREKTKQTLADRPIVWIEEAAAWASTHKAVCALGTTHRQAFIEQAAALGFRFAAVIHPSARVSGRSTVGEGSIVSAGVIIAGYTAVGRHVVLNRGCLIGHHTIIHDYATISPGANIAASAVIGEAAYIGMGAIVVDHVTIGAHSFIGAGAVVTHDVPDHVQVMGARARIAKRGIEGK